MTVNGALAGSLTPAGQATTLRISIGTLSGSVSAPEDAGSGSGIVSNTSIGAVTSTGSVSTGAISSMTVTGTMAGSLSAAGQRTITRLSIRTLSGSVSAPEDAGSGP